MDKLDFLLALGQRLDVLSDEDRRASLDYYSEMLDDLIESGMTEQEACQEAGRCLRCDKFGYGSLKGGRAAIW